mmetsp:Transcript_111560/g.356103  ORF Transcript_111560/g.356103 Transcript_111560/m.356103 type:complete len:699 (-) Transcript_111560:15-2111(-)
MVGEGGTWFQRRAAVRLLPQQAARGGVEAVSTAKRALLEDASADVREAAALVLRELALEGDREVLERLCTAARTDNADVRCAALGSLASLAGGDPGALACTAELAAPGAGQGAEVRSAALAALRQVAEGYWLADRADGFEHVVQAAAVVAGCTREADAALVVPALEALPALAPAAPAAAEEAACTALARAAVPRSRAAAAAALAELAVAGSEDTLQALLVALEDGDSAVRAAAARAVPRLACTGPGGQGESCVRALRALAGDASDEVRAVAVEALSRAAPRGHQPACFTAVQGLADESAAVRQAAARALLSLAEEGGSDLLLSALGELLAHPEEEVRQASAAVLEEICDPEEDDRVLQQACRHLNHRLRRLRAEARALLERFGGQGHPVVLEACIRGLRCYERDEVRHDAVMALQQFCGGSPDAVACEELAGLVENDPSSANRLAALRVLPAVGQGKEVAVRAAAAALADAEEAVREEAVRAMGILAGAADPRALELLADMLPLPELRPEQRPARRVRVIEAMEALARGSDDAATVEVLAEMTVDFDLDVRLAALRALEAVAARGNELALDAVAALLDCDDPVTCSQAASRFHLFADRWDQEAAFAAMQRTQSEACECRLAALQALASVIDPGRGPADVYEEPEEEVLAQLRHLSEADPHPPLRSAAAALLRHVEERRPVGPLSEGLGHHLQRLAGLA